MKVRNTIAAAGIALAFVIPLGGCARWSVERHDAQVAQYIDSRLSMEMTRDDFLEFFPDAQLIDESGAAAKYLVTEQSTCFACYSRKAFQRSVDIFARVVVFQDDRLSAIEPVREMPP